MWARRARRRALALVLAPLLVLVGISRVEAYYVCAGDAVARTRCCCPASASPPSDEARIAATCCSIEERGAVAPVARSSDRAGAPAVDLPLVAATTPVVAALRTALVVDVERRAHAPPRSAARASQHVVFLL